MESNNLGHQELVDHPGSLLDSSVQMGSFGGVPDSQVWSQDFLMDGAGNDQNMQNNFAPHMNEVLCNSRPLRQDEQQLLNQECDQNHLKKIEEMSGHGPWEMRSQLSSNFQPDDSLNLSNNIAGKQHIPALPNYNLQLLDDRLHNSCTISDMGSWSMSPSSYTHPGIDMSILPPYQPSNVKEEYISMPSYSTSNSSTTFLQGFGPSDSYKINESGLPNMLDSHGNKTIFKSHHLGPMHHDYNIHAAHAFLPPMSSKLSSGLLTFGSNNCLSMPVMDFLNSKPTEIRLHRPHSGYLEGKPKLQNSHQSRAMSLHGTSDSSPEQKRSSSASHESTSDAVFKRPRLEANSSLTTFKVRKEKLGDRITALQQLVSPFGKTDTASVLLEAIGYIKFLQEQVRALSMPYMKTGCSSTAQGKGWGSSEQKDSNEARQDLRSRGLCLVPISCTLHVANDNGADYWSPSLGGTYR
ncbi:transcription factor bHLH68 isoform X2 [Cryptomeria japonica]|uniref:transcription factor bHLH68 isoform X2 n=1 Tax=Cryptomeria japonica TaxID=3369 RepID=UPI0025AB8209|nr:transcription factor bHLH68 isoform X2 [Cryptomeria japonica]